MTSSFISRKRCAHLFGGTKRTSVYGCAPAWLGSLFRGQPAVRGQQQGGWLHLAKGAAGSITRTLANSELIAGTGMSAPVVGVPTPFPFALKGRVGDTEQKRGNAGEGGKDSPISKEVPK